MSRADLRFDSIRLRLLLIGALLIGAALLAGYLFISTILKDFITGRFDAETDVVTEALIASANIDGAGSLVPANIPTDPRFLLPLSGWYWQMSQGGEITAKSDSLLDHVLPIPERDLQGALRSGPSHQMLRTTAAIFTLPDAGTPLTVTVTAPQAEIDSSLALVRRPLAISLAMLGLALTLASVIQVMTGLRSLDRLGRDIRSIRAGDAELLPLPPVAELRPVAHEINGLLDQNRRVLARTREHVGNLAHSLKTPLAALSNSLDPDHPGQALIARMDRQIGWHLRRARSAGAPRLLGQRTPIAPVVDDILLVLRRSVEDAGLIVENDCPPALVFAGERQDLEEMIGNLAENAVKWAHSRILVSAKSLHQEGEPFVLIGIEDDGPGMPEDEHANALARGQRLDETGPPGAGLGLAIVADIAALHGGKLSLARSHLGGLAATLELPA